MQGADLRDGVLATGKHFLGYAMTEGGQNMAATTVGARELYAVYARPFEAGIRLCGLGAVMASYAEFDGVPIHVSRDVLTKLLRGRMGFNGTVVSDYVGVGWAQTRQRVAKLPRTSERSRSRPAWTLSCRHLWLRAGVAQCRSERQGSRIACGRVHAPRAA
jgi:hypothetical protein